jgi:Ni,Fe-hydrogenase III large subunit
MMNEMLMTRNGSAVALDQIPKHEMAAFQRLVSRELHAGRRAVSFFGIPASHATADLMIVLADDTSSELRILSTHVAGGHFPSLTPEHSQLHLFEREICEQTGLRPDGHPWLKPVRYPDGSVPAGTGDFYRVEGDDIHEVAVGPVHAGIIEPGHFRFQCHGEEVFHLEIALGYQHRGIEAALSNGQNPRAASMAETIAGDTSIGHATAYCQTVEALSGQEPPVRAQAIRAILLELERLANHTGDLGALSGDVAFLPTASFNGRIRGDFLNMTALLCGNRFGRAAVRPGGVLCDLESPRARKLLEVLQRGFDDVRNAVELLFDTPSVLARFEHTGTVPAEVATALGAVGPAARASGLRQDIRCDHPAGFFRFAQIPLMTCETGDVYARAYVRWLEIQHSVRFIQNVAGNLPEGPLMRTSGALKPNHLAIAMVEGWRGQLTHVALTDATGTICHRKITDPSFHNWSLLAYALRNQQISDFPLCNKSFNLSYCGHDL